MYINGIATEFFVGGRHSLEYGKKIGPGSVSSCYIEAKDSQEFYIDVDLNDYPHGEFVVGVWVDGTAVYYGSNVNEEESFHSITRARFEKCCENGTSTFVLKNMSFAPLEDVSGPRPEIMDRGLDVNMSNLDQQKGKIVIEIALEPWSDVVATFGTMSPFEFHQHNSPGAPVNEKVHEHQNGVDKSCQALSHKVIFTETEAEETIKIPPEHRRGWAKGPVIGTFIYNYVSAGILDDLELMDDGVIDNTPPHQIFETCKTLLKQKKALKLENKKLRQQNNKFQTQDATKAEVMDLTQD